MRKFYLRATFALSAGFASSLLAFAQCPVDTVLVKGRVETAAAHAKVRVQLLYAKGKRGESGEVTVEEGAFQIPIEFVTVQSSIFSNIPARCGRKPKTIVITLLENDQSPTKLFWTLTRPSESPIQVLTRCGPNCS